MKWEKLQRAVFVTFLVCVAILLLVYELWTEKVKFTEIKMYINDLGIWGPLAFIALYTIGTIFIPSTPFMAAAGIFFGFKYGLLYTIIGGFLSSVIVFVISRKLGKNWVDDILSRKYGKILSRYNERLEKSGIYDLIILRILPIMPFNVLNILMGVSKIKLGSYIVGTLIGLIPSNIIAVYFGDIIAKIL